MSTEPSVREREGVRTVSQEEEEKASSFTTKEMWSPRERVREQKCSCPPLLLLLLPLEKLAARYDTW